MEKRAYKANDFIKFYNEIFLDRYLSIHREWSLAKRAIEENMASELSQALEDLTQLDADVRKLFWIRETGY